MSHVPRPHAGATSRLAYVMAATYPESGLAAAQRAWLRDRLAQASALTPEEDTRIWAVVRPWLARDYPAVLAIVERGAPERTLVHDTLALAYLAGTVHDTDEGGA